MRTIQEAGLCQRVLVYRLGSIGDTLVALPAFHLVREVFARAHITLLTNIPVKKKVVSMETLLKATGLCDEVLSYATSLRNFSKLRMLRRDLRAGRYDCLVYLTEPKGGILRSLRDYVFFRLCGIRRIIGIPYSGRALRPAKLPGTGLSESETSRVMACVRELGEVDLRDQKWWELKLSGDECAEADATLAAARITGRFLAVSIGTKIQPNDWEEPNWTALMKRLAVDFPGLPLVLLGAGEERERCARLAALWRAPAANLCGSNSPRVSAAVLRSAVTMVCHDSGPMHLAATMGVPCVAIFSARNAPGVWFPRGENHTVLYHDVPCAGCKLTLCLEQKKACILSITVDEVYAAVCAQLARAGIVPSAKSS